MAIIAKYKFNSSLYSDYLPIFNDEFTGYTKTDVNNGDGTITRTISHDTLKPTYMRFGVAMNSSTDREKSLIEVIECDTSEVTNMGNMFFGCHSLISLNVSNFNTSKATNMQYMFNDCKLLTSLDLSNFDTSKVTNFDSIFENCTSLATINVSSWDTSKVTNMAYMFNNCNKLTSLDVSNFNTSQVTSMFKMFQNCSSLTSLYVSNFNTSKVTNISNMFMSCKSLTSLDLSSFNTSNVTTMTNVFHNCSSLTSLDLSNFDTSNITTMQYMFNNCSSLTSLDLSSFDTSNVTNMDSIFENCSALTSLDLSNFDTSKVTNMQYMFNKCSLLTSLDLSNFNTSNVTTMYYMFNGCNSLTLLDVSSFDTSKVNNMNYMFNGCSKLTSLDLSNFDTSNVTNMDSIFENCSALTSLDLSNFDTSKVTNMQYMFNKCSLLTSLDLSNFNTSQVTNMRNMFASCSKLTTLDLSNFDTSQVTNMAYILSDCIASDIGLLYATSATINSLVTALGTSVARNIYYTDAPLNELTVQDNITYKEYKITMATFPYTLNKLPNGVADYIDVVNKVHVQRVGRVTFNGTETERTWIKGEMHSNNPQKDNLSRFYYGGGSGYNDLKTSSSMLSDKLPYANVTADRSEIESVGHMGNAYFNIIIRKDRLVTDDADGFKTWLQSNPITILHELATPIYTPLTDEEIAQLPLSAYKDGYVMLSSNQLTPSFEFRMRASNRYQVDMLETGYYYLNAPVGNVKLGTANVDVQQMPCIIKVDNVGTGDSAYRLGFGNGFCEDVKLTVDGYYLNIYNGELLVNSSRATSDYVYIDYYGDLCVEDLGNREYFDMVFYDEDKRYISFVSWDMVKNYGKFKAPQNAKYFRVSIIHKGNKVIRVFAPITLAKLPSHRIPSPFTQGMKCGTNFGYWEGIIGASASVWNTEVENMSLSILNSYKLNRIEHGGTIVEDEFDVATGKFTKRVGKTLIDERHTNNVVAWNNNTGDYCTFYIYIDKTSVGVKNSKASSIILNNILPSNTGGYLGTVNGINRIHSSGYIPFSLHKDVLGVSNVNNVAEVKEAAKLFIRNHPVIIYYELEVPEVTYLTPPKNQLKTKNGGTYTFLGCHSGTLRAQCKPSHLTYPVPSLVGNRTYTVVHNRKNISGSTKPITLDLGGTQVELNDASGKTLVKTPSSLKHSSLIFIGGESTVDHIMVLDGDWANKPIEYFENMMGHDTDAIITIIGNGQIDDVEEQYLW